MEQEIEQLIKDAEVALRAGKTDQAHKIYTNVLERDKNSASALYALGTIALQQKNYQIASEYLDRAAEIEPEAVDIAFNYATCLATIGNRIGALMQLQRATKYCKDDPVFCPRIADMSISLGEPAAAITLLSRLNELLPQDQIILAKAQGRLGNWREAVSILKRLNDNLPKDPVVADKLATAAGNLRDYPTSIKAYERYLQLVSPTAKDYLRFADLLLLAQNADRCRQALDIALEMGEDSPEVYILKARTARLLGDYENVYKSLECALERQANHAQAWSIKAELASDDQLGEFSKTLQKELDDKHKMAELSHHFQALLHYASADMHDRNGDFKSAANALMNANKVQYSALEMNNGTYQAEGAENQFTKLIADFNKDVFVQSEPIIENQETKIQPIFIVGVPRSGTTLVERILGQNESVFNAGEQEAMEYVAVEYRQHVAGGKLDEPAKVNAEQWAALRTMYLEKLPEITKPMFTDKLPHNFRNVGLILKLFPDAKIIQMHRDKKDVCLSVFSHAFAQGHNYSNRWEDLNHFYTQTERLMAHWTSLKSPQILDLNYEDLVQDPNKYAKKLVEFCGFEWDKSYLDFYKSVNQSFTFSEIEVRQKIADKRVGRWQNYADSIPELSDL